MKIATDTSNLVGQGLLEPNLPSIPGEASLLVCLKHTHTHTHTQRCGRKERNLDSNIPNKEEKTCSEWKEGWSMRGKGQPNNIFLKRQL